MSRQNALAAFLVTWLIVGPSVWLIFVLAGEGMRIGLSLGLVVGLNRGGSAVIKHYALRLALWLNGYTPFTFVSCSAYPVRGVRMILRQVQYLDGRPLQREYNHLHAQSAEIYT